MLATDIENIFNTGSEIYRLKYPVSCMLCSYIGACFLFQKVPCPVLQCGHQTEISCIVYVMKWYCRLLFVSTGALCLTVLRCRHQTVHHLHPVWLVRELRDQARTSWGQRSPHRWFGGGQDLESADQVQLDLLSQSRVSYFIVTQSNV